MKITNSKNLSEINPIAINFNVKKSIEIFWSHAFRFCSIKLIKTIPQKTLEIAEIVWKILEKYLWRNSFSVKLHVCNYFTGSFTTFC